MFPRQNYYIMSADTELTVEKLGYWIQQHQKDCFRFQYLKDMYEGRHPIQLAPPKEAWKPDNRIICNFAKYIVDTFNGYFIGIPVKTMHPDELVAAELEEIQNYNDQDDNNSELSKNCSIYGSAFELLYTDENARICTTYLSPLECFMIYDDSVARKPLYGVRYYQNTDGEMVGSVFTKFKEIPFSDVGGLHFGDAVSHYFNGMPLIEYIENEERQGIFEQVESAICAYEKAISEKANDVDYFADAYLLLLGLKLDEKELYTIHSDRVIHVGAMEPEELNAIRVEFLQRPSADATQENLLNRLEDQIFTQSMVANISDESFGSASGTAFQTLDKALQVAKQYQMATIRLTAGQIFTASETVSGIGTGVILWGNNIDFRSTSNSVQTVIDANVCALLGTGTFIGVQINGFFTATRSDITLSSCKAEDLTVSAGTTVSMKNCELASISCDFSEMRMAGCTVDSTIADNCSMVYMDSATTIANKTTDNGGMFYVNGIPETQ